MATVTSFESLARPSRSELRQFAELFAPLFAASSDEARRQAVAALSQSTNVPPAVAFFIASQPIAISAPFLATSQSLTDDVLITIARTQGEAHARAIVRREALSPTVIDALVGLRHDRGTRRDEVSETMSPPVPVQAAVPANQAPARQVPAEQAPARAAPVGSLLNAAPPPLTAIPTAEELEGAARLLREEQLRLRLKALAGQIDRPHNDRLGLRNVTPVQESLLVRFARNRETSLFAAVLADTLSASRWLSERIMLDISGQQLATTLKGLAMQPDDGIFILLQLYPHLNTEQQGRTLAEWLWKALDADDCGKRIEAWRRADSYTYADPKRTSELAIEPEQQVRPLRTSASSRKTLHAAGTRNR